MNIFLSYSWNDEKVANVVCDFFKSLAIDGVEILRDKDRIQYMQDIKDFMKKIRTTDYAILILSESYLKSINCMYEITELIKDDGYKKRILLLVDKRSDIYNITKISMYLEYWNNKCIELESQCVNIPLCDKGLIIEELRKANEIKHNFSVFLNDIKYLKSIVYDNNITIDDFSQMKVFLGYIPFTIEEQPNTYYVLNVPRTLKKWLGDSMIWWHNNNQTYTDNLSEARIFSREEIEELISSKHPYNDKKFTAIPTSVVAKFNQCIISMSYRFLDIIYINRKSIIGNKSISLSDNEIEMLG